jgi:hypothetical protein
MIRDNNLFTKEGPRGLLLVADCRPQTNARAHLAMGGGYENYPGTQLEFCELQGRGLWQSTAHPVCSKARSLFTRVHTHTTARQHPQHSRRA